MSNIKSQKVGEIRPTQLLFTFGVGALIDLPHLSVIVMGLEWWDKGTTISEERLLTIIRNKLGHQVLQLSSPPLPEDSNSPTIPLNENNFIGVPVSVFPQWMLCPKCRSLIPVSSGLLDFKSDAVKVDKNRYVHNNCLKAKKPPDVVPARFLVACKKGHLNDFPWEEFVHKDQTCHGRLKFKEMGIGARGIDLYVECEDCRSIRSLAEAFTDPHRVLGKCKGKHPHLNIEEECEEKLYCIVLGASNSWFPLLFSVLSVPTSDNEIVETVNKYWQTYFHDVEEPAGIKYLLKIDCLKRLSKYTKEEIWEVIQQRENNTAADDDTDETSDIKGPEWKLLTNPSLLSNNKDLQLKEIKPPDKYKKYFSQVVLVERLREVRALVGFTRIEAPGDLSDSDEFNYDNVAPLSRAKPTWVPAIEIRGEGIFIQFDEKVIQDWLKLDSVKKRDQEFFFSHRKWREIRKIEPKDAGYPTIRYILLHTFAHALMRQLSIECGYTAASIRERIYSLSEDDPRGPRAGVLIYTSTPDSEGTLGGLVSLGKPETLVRHIEQALEASLLCSSDPICSEHPPSQDGKTLHGASCHACLFSPEPSCERGNKYLDRALLVNTMNSECGDIAFFRD